jgi:ectoine hydroxylase-related dioxygenase (phytanoyl-CoA dioxygenase family)
MTSTTTAPEPAASAPAALAPAPEFRPGIGHWISKSLDQSLFAPAIMQTEHPQWHTMADAERLFIKDGYVVIPKLFNDQESSRLLDHLVTSGGPDSQYEVKNWCFNKSIDFEVQKRPDWLWAVDKEPAIDLLDLLLGSDCKVMGAGLWSTGPGRQMGLHVDHRAFHFPPELVLPENFVFPAYIAVLIAALEDQEPSMGPTAIVPGSHRNPPRPGGPLAQPRGLLMKKGDAVVVRTDVCHGATMNTGPRRRNHFHSTWCATYFDTFGPPLRHSKYWAPEVAAAATVRQRRILGGWPMANGGREAIWRSEMGLEPGTAAAAY